MMKVALVIGGGSGMGADSARRLRADGFEVGVMSSSGKGEALGLELGGLGYTGSNRESADIEAFRDAAMAKWGRIDAVVSSAGHGPRASILELSDDDWHEGLEFYMLGAVRAARAIAPVMEAQGGGAFVNISTFAAFEPDPVFPTSGVSRAGLAAFTKLFSDAYASKNIRMNNVLPGFIDSLPEKEEFRTRIPMERYGSSYGEIAATVSFLCSDGAGYITGQNIRVDGGITRSV